MATYGAGDGNGSLRRVYVLFPVLERRKGQTAGTLSGTTILFVEQYVRHALSLADIVVILHKDRIEFIGEPGELEQDERPVESYLGTSGAEGAGHSS